MSRNDFRWKIAVPESGALPWGGVLPAAILAGVILTRHPQELPLKPELPLGRLGEFLTGPYVLAFELISVVLLAAMAGAVVLGFERRKGA